MIPRALRGRTPRCSRNGSASRSRRDQRTCARFPCTSAAPPGRSTTALGRSRSSRRSTTPPDESTQALRALAEYYRASGADVIDVGCTQGRPFPELGSVVHKLRDAGLRVSVDSFDREEIRTALDAGAEMVLSVNARRINRFGNTRPYPSPSSWRMPGARHPPRCRGKADNLSRRNMAAGKPSHPLPCPLMRTVVRRSRWMTLDCNASATTSYRPRNARSGWASRSSNCTRRTAICCINFCRPCRMRAPISMAARWRTACASRSKCSRRYAAPCQTTRRWVFGFPPRTGWMAAGTSSRASCSPRNCSVADAPSSMYRAAGCRPCSKSRCKPGYQVPFAERVRRDTGMPTIAVGLITEPDQAETIVASGQADMVALARGMLYDPRWPWHAAAQLGAQVDAPKQYWRSQPREFKNLFKP